jgi:hypothetical protein
MRSSAYAERQAVAQAAGVMTDGRQERTALARYINWNEECKRWLSYFDADGINIFLGAFRETPTIRPYRNIADDPAMRR